MMHMLRQMPMEDEEFLRALEIVKKRIEDKKQ
jgi:hypothetical protein